MGLNRREGGFTLLEMTIVITLAAVFLPMFIVGDVDRLGQKFSDVVIDQTVTVWDAARNYYVSNSDTWPDQANNCANAINVLKTGNYLGGMTNKNAWNGNIVTSCVAGQPVFMVQQDTRSDWAGYVANSLPSTVVVTGVPQRTLTTIPAPGTSAATANLLSRVIVPGRPELNRMETNLDMGGHNVNNALAVNSVAVNAFTAQIGTVDSTTVKTTSVIVNGQPVIDAYGVKAKQFAFVPRAISPGSVCGSSAGRPEENRAMVANTADNEPYYCMPSAFGYSWEPIRTQNALKKVGPIESIGATATTTHLTVMCPAKSVAVSADYNYTRPYFSGGGCGGNYDSANLDTFKRVESGADSGWSVVGRCIYVELSVFCMAKS